MRSLIVSTYDYTGGAARAAFRLHNSFLRKTDNNIESSMLVKNKSKSDNNIFSSNSLNDKILWKAKIFIARNVNKLQYSENKVIHSPSFLPSNLHQYINRNDFDVVNLHWVQDEMLSIESIGKIKKPLFWTIHDCWPFSGSEHYPNGLRDKRYQEGYLKNNRLRSSSGIDIDKWCWDRKLRNWKKPINIICPSRWIETCVKNSVLMRDWPTFLIPNPLPTNIYKPWSKKIARELFKFPKKKFLLMFSSLDTKDPRKGYDLLNSVLETLSKITEIEFEIVVLGKYKKNSNTNISLKYHYIDALYDDQSIAMLYSAVDLMLVPSRMENLPQSATEAQSCGIPVIGFDCTGMSDVIINDETGFLVKPYEIKEFARVIEFLLMNPEKIKLFSINARNFAVRNWSEEVISQKYSNLYGQVLQDNF